MFRQAVRTGDLRRWQGDKTTSTTLSEAHQPSPTERIHSGSIAPLDADPHQGSPTVHGRCVPPVFHDGARSLDVAQAAVLPGWTKDAVRAACERGELVHKRDHLNAYRISCWTVAAFWHGRQGEAPRSAWRRSSLWREDAPITLILPC